ncbi:hypothetical protein Bca4012_032298 [Brassica carinata]
MAILCGYRCYHHTMIDSCRDKREKEQQRLCNIQRDDDAVTSQTPQEPTTSNAGDALRKNPSYHQSVHRRIMKCMRDYKSKEETVLHLLDQYDQHMVVSACPFSMELCCIHGQSISQAMSSKKQEEEEGNARTTFENVATEIINQ